MAELERGDGAWENIQEVLRSEFVKVWAAIADNGHINDETERRLRGLEGSCAGKASADDLVKQHALIEDLERAVDALSERVRSQQMKLHASEERTRALVQASLDKLQRYVESQALAVESSVFSRLSALEDSCVSMLRKMERRLELVEEELSAFVAAIDKKADAACVDGRLAALKKATDEAIRRRCKKTAFEQEVLALHALLQRQHDSIDGRLSSELAQANATSAALMQSEIGRLGALQREERLSSRHELEERVAQAAAEQRSALSALQDALSALQDALSAQLAKKLASASESHAAAAAAWRQELQEALVAAQQLQETRLQEEHDRARQQATDALEHQLLAWKGSISTDWAQLQLRVADGAAKSEAIAQLQTNQQRLQLATDELKTQLTSAACALSAAEQRLLAHTRAQAQELREQLRGDVERLRAEGGARASDRKLARQQLGAVSEKLGELDQVVKLVGKQLIQNTSLLHALRSEQHAQRQVRKADELALLAPDLQFAVHSAEPEAASSEKSADENETALRALRSQHETLRDAIRDKLRHYEHVLQQRQEEEE